MLEAMGFINALISENLPLFAFLGVAGGMVIYWKNGGISMSGKIIDNFRTRVDQLEKDVIRLTKADSEKTAEIGRLNGIIESKDGQIQHLQSILTNRDPAMQAYLQETGKMLKRIEELLEIIHKKSEKNEKQMDEQTTLLRTKTKGKK